MSKVLLLDFLNLVHRSNIKFGVQDNDKISYTIVYNFFRSLKAAINTFEPNKVFICQEGLNNYRYSLYSEYKANRMVKKASEANENLSRQRDIICKLLPMLSLTQVYADKFEADDVIASLSENLKDEEVIILSTDSDFIQLLQADIGVKLFNPIKKEYVEAPTYHYLAWKSLRGDKSDNIPGLVSDAKALAMVENPKLLENFLLSEENKIGFNLNKSLIELSKVPEEELIFIEGKNNFEIIEDEFKKMEFKTLLVDKYWNSFKETFSSL